MELMRLFRAPISSNRSGARNLPVFYERLNFSQLIQAHCADMACARIDVAFVYLLEFMVWYSRKIRACRLNLGVSVVSFDLSY